MEWPSQKIKISKLHSFAKNKAISLHKAHGAPDIHDLFSLHVSVEAYSKMQDLQLQFLT